VATPVLAHVTLHAPSVQCSTLQAPAGHPTLHSGVPAQSTVTELAFGPATLHTSSESHTTEHGSPTAHVMLHGAPPGSHL
jgi:hypothetical protein